MSATSQLKDIIERYAIDLETQSHISMQNQSPFLYGNMQHSVKSEHELNNKGAIVSTYMDGGYISTHAPTHFDYSGVYLFGRTSYNPSPPHPELITETLAETFRRMDMRWNR